MGDVNLELDRLINDVKDAELRRILRIMEERERDARVKRELRESDLKRYMFWFASVQPFLIIVINEIMHQFFT